MSFTPHTHNDIQTMLETIGIKNIAELFDEIPANLLSSGFSKDIIPEAINEFAAKKLFANLARRDEVTLNFIGAGAYEHHIPEAVWQVASRGEFLTSYTPYQAEASQGSLQVIYEYQSMMSSLLGLDVANASLYDGASSVAESALMAVRANRKVNARRVLVAGTLHPHYRECLQSIVSQLDIEVIEIPFSKNTGTISLNDLNAFAADEFAALIIPQPNFFGQVEDVDLLTDWAHERNALVVAVVNPTAMALLKEPGSWGKMGADIACGEGQPLGSPLASGGPYFGFMSCKEALIRQMPGRLVGRTIDADGNPGFVLTLQAREQHIRRSKATSNICTNQGLLVTAATIYMSLLGPIGLKRVAEMCYANTEKLLQALSAINGVDILFKSAHFHEGVIKLNQNADQVLEQLSLLGIQGGYSLQKTYPQLENCILVCATETKDDDDIQTYVDALAAILSGKTKQTSTTEATSKTVTF